ncbi:unnamed protein product [Orchesella dallaii]|uniref:RING-type domain-containing protein n=1 Tax=Orchesella dallaii TaxID=48710 RepID=A0ABP1QM28_9HEXA
MAEVTSESKETSNIMDELAHSDSVRKLIECPVCLELPLPPIYVCAKGHIVCNSCQARTYSCPLCRENYSTTRGFVAEGIIEQCMLRCKFADHGCPLTMRGSALVDHLDVCDYRPVICVDCGGKLIDFDGYEDHLLKFHRINGISQSRAYVIYSMNLTHRIHFGEKCCWPQYYLKAFGQTFLLRLYATHWFVCAWLSLLGPKSDCSKYEVILEFHPTSNDTVVHTWQGPVNHFRDDPPKEIYLQGRGLITPLETLMEIAPVANDHAEWLYNIEILEANLVEDKLDCDCDTTTSTETNSGENSLEINHEERSPVISATKRPTEGESGLDGNTQASARAIPDAAVNNGSSNSARVVLRVPSSPMYNFADTPRRISTPLRTPTSTMSINANGNPGNTTILSPGPAVLSPSTSTLAAAATVTSVVPTPSSLMENFEASSSAPYSSYGSTSSQGAVSVTTGRSTSRLLRRASSLCAFLQGTNRASYGLNEEDWICSSESEEE